MKANLTKLINDCISLGLEMADKRTSTEQAVRQAKSIAIHCLPDDCDADLDLVEEHVQNLRAFADLELNSLRQKLINANVSHECLVKYHKGAFKVNEFGEIER